MPLASKRLAVLTRLRRHEETLALRELGERVQALEVTERRIAAFEEERSTLLARVGEEMESDQPAARLSEIVSRAEMLDRALVSGREELERRRAALVTARRLHEDQRGARKALDLLVDRQRRLEQQIALRRELATMDEFAARRHRRTTR